MGLLRFRRQALSTSRFAALGILVVSSACFGQDRAPTIEERLSDPVYMSWISHAKVSDCISCHFAGPNPAQIESGRSSSLTAFSRRSEMESWLRKDKHTIARRRVEPFAAAQNESELVALIQRLDEQAGKAIAAYRDQGITVDASKIGLKSVPAEWIGDSNILSRRICDKLWGENSVSTPQGYAKFRDNCLTCHGGYQSGATGFDHGDRDSAQLGIDCLYCHQIGDNSKWVGDHSAPRPEENWRLLPRQQKSEAGMRDLVDTSNQASLCLDCHVGNRSKNMFVTHEMYAAGHPPIPSIELQKFCQEMPQHWQTPAQLYDSLKDYQGRDKYFETNYPDLTTKVSPDKIYWDTRKMLVGALAARKQGLQLYIDSATAHQWADYSLYDCAACHHELQTVSQRQLRGYPGAPGRPRPHEWPAVLLDLAYDIRPQLRDIEAQMAGYFSDQPFGDATVIGQSAQQLSDQIEESIAVVERVPIDHRIARKMLQRLAATPQDQLLTYDSARQVVWAMQSIAAEIKRDQNASLDDKVASMIASLGDPQTTGIAAEIPAGRERFIYRQGLKDDLERRAKFDPATLTTKLKQIGQALSASPVASR